MFGLKHPCRSLSGPMSRSRRRTARLTVESLEGRCLPATFVVTTTADIIDPDDGVLSLREAVLAANARPGGDDIRLPAASGADPLTRSRALTYRLSVVNDFFDEDENAAATGDLDISDDLTIIGAGPTLTMIDAAGIDRVLDVRSGNVVVRGLTITGGLVPSRSIHGGGIRNEGTLTIKDCAIRRNSAWLTRGGGVANLGALVVRNTVIAENSASSGGGISNNGTLEVVSSTIENNRTSPGGGGGISNARGAVVLTDTIIAGNGRVGISNGVEGALTLNHCVVANNGARTGGGIVNSGILIITGGSIRDNGASTDGGGGIRNTPTGRFTITDATISGNHGGFGGAGGIFNEGSGDIVRTTISGNDAETAGGILNGQEATLRMTQSTVSGNLAYFGSGGGALNLGSMALTNVTFSGNEAESGAAIYNGGGLTLTNVTIARNVAGEFVRGSGGGVFNAGDLRLINTLIADNAAGAAPDLDNQGIIGRARNNLIGSPEGHDLRWGDDGNIVGVAPVLSELGDFGGPTLVHAPLPGSPAIDTGTSLAAPLTDQRGIARPLDGDGDGVAIYDIGAVEILNPHYLVTLVVPTQLGLRLDGMALELVDLPAQQIIIKEPFNSAGSMHIDGSQGADSLIVLGDGLGGWPISFAGRGGDDLLSVQLASAPPAQTAANPLPLLVRFEGGEGTGDRFRLRGNDRAEDIQLIAKQGQAAQPHFDIVARDVASGLPTLRMAAAQTEAFAVHAGGGADFVALNLSGAWSGAVLAFDLDTGDGNDRLRVAIDAVLAGLKVRADGGAGDDDLEMAVAADGAQELFLLLDGGSGFDVGRATANVLVKNIEQFTPIGK